MQIVFWMIFSALFGYLLGSLSSAVLVSRVLQLPDPRESGSKNPGATNVLRIGGKKAAVLTLCGDVCKGLLAVMVIKMFTPLTITAWLLAGLCAFIGHLFPLFFKFKGGKGVATACGVLLAWQWQLAVVALIIWGAVFAWTRISSLAALAAAFILPWFAFAWLDDYKISAATLAMVALLVWRHRDNIARLRNGEEKPFRKK